MRFVPNFRRLRLDGRRFAAVVVTNYLHRPLLPALVACVASSGLLIYETFAAGNERFGRPSNPDFLLRPGELPDPQKTHERRRQDVLLMKPR